MLDALVFGGLGMPVGKPLGDEAASAGIAMGILGWGLRLCHDARPLVGHGPEKSGPMLRPSRSMLSARCSPLMDRLPNRDRDTERDWSEAPL